MDNLVATKGAGEFCDHYWGRQNMQLDSIKLDYEARLTYDCRWICDAFFWTICYNRITKHVDNIVLVTEDQLKTDVCALKADVQLSRAAAYTRPFNIAFSPNERLH